MSRKTQIKPEWIVTTLGTIYSLATTIRLVCTDPDDGIIVTTPVYNRYRQAADRLNKKDSGMSAYIRQCKWHLSNGF